MSLNLDQIPETGLILIMGPNAQAVDRFASLNGLPAIRTRRPQFMMDVEGLLPDAMLILLRGWESRHGYNPQVLEAIKARGIKPILL